MRKGSASVRPMQPGSKSVVAAGLLLTFFSIPHLIDDFLFGVPEEFGLSEPFAQLLSGVFAVVLVLSIVLSAQDLRIGYGACLAIGIFLASAGLLKHLPEMIKQETYWSGLFSEFLIFGVIASSLLLFGVSFLALRRFTE
jgi:hypothetical protein